MLVVPSKSLGTQPTKSYLELRKALVETYVDSNRPSRWSFDWTTAIFLIGAADDDLLHHPKLESALDVALKRWEASGRKILTMPDEAVMALPLIKIKERRPDKATKSSDELINRGKRFFQTESLNAIGAIDHVGRRHRFAWFLPPTTLLVPSSIWADSMVMSVLTQLHVDGPAFEERALAQAKLFHQKLNSSDSLYKHAFYVGSGKLVPTHGHWLRGNGWMLYGISEIIRLTSPELKANQEMRQILKHQLLNLKKYFDPENGFKTLIDLDTSSNYFESSGLALVTAAWANAIKMKILTDDDSKLFLKDLEKVALKYISQSGHQLKVTQVSKPTTASRYSWYYTKVVDRGENLSYGVGAYLLMFTALERAQTPLL